MAQVMIQAMCKKNTLSLRDAIVNDEQLSDYYLKVAQHKKPGRSNGWATLHSTTPIHGALKVEWDDDTRVLICRVITKAAGKPDKIIADFLHYLLARHKRKIEFINLVPR